MATTQTRRKLNTVAKVYLVICYGLELAMLLTFGGADGNPQLPTAAFLLATLPLSAAWALWVPDVDWIESVLILVLPAANCLLGWLVWSVLRRWIGARTDAAS